MEMDDICWDFLNLLHPDVAGRILTRLDDPGDVVRASSVSRVWRDFVVKNGICKHLCLKLFPQLSGIACIEYVSNKQQNGSEAGSSLAAEVEHLKKEHKVFSTLARGLTSSDVGECLSDAISATSTDNFPEEGVRNTLEPRDRIGRSASYWSSSGQSKPEVPERLTYMLTSDICVITEISVQPFQAFFQANSPIYSAKAVRFRMGHRILPDHDEEEAANFSKLNGGQPFPDENYVWTYTSKEFPMAQVNSLQKFKLPEPVLCIGGIVQIELLGRVQKQEMDGLYYICIAHVQVQGRSLAPVFRANPLETPGKYVLMFDPLAHFSFTPSIDEDSDVELSPEEEMVQRHIRGWENILNMLRGTLGVEVYDSEDEEHFDSDDGN